MSVRRRATVLSALLLAAAGGAAAQSARSRILWVKGKPHLHVRLLDVAPPAGLKEIYLSVSVYDSENRRIWAPRPKIVLVEAKVKAKPKAKTPPKDAPGTVTVELKRLGKPNTEHRVEVDLRSDALKLDYSERLYFARPDQPVRSYSIRRLGTFPNEKFLAVLALKAVPSKDNRKTQIGFAVRDGDQNVVLDKLRKVDLPDKATWHSMEVTPGADAIGPHELELKVENNALGWMVEATRPFAVANALVPVSSFEIDDRTWSTIAEASDLPVAEPRIAYDPTVAHSGKQSLKIDYRPRGAQVVHGFQVLPGLPTMLGMWVKGNGSEDLLFVTFHDYYETTRSHWLRFPTTSRERVCKLDFQGWRRFRVPILGGGLQKVSEHGSSNDIDAPIIVASLEVHGRWRRTKEQPEMPRQAVWIDDLSVETQARSAERVCLELRTDTPDRMLHKDARVFVSVGNGGEKDTEAGKLRVVAKDRPGQTVLQVNRDVKVPAGGFTTVEIPLKAAFDKRPLGPVDVDVWFTDPAAPGRRATGRTTLKSPRSYGLAWDFETPEKYNALRYNRGLWADPNTGGQTVPGGAEGSARALRVSIGPEEPNSVLLHPAIPGMVDRIEVLLRAPGKPVVLQPILVDAGQTGHTNKTFNTFYLPEIKVSGSAWQKAVLVAPAVPPRYDVENVNFMNQPFYPLNLAFRVRIDGEAGAKPPPGATAEVFLDSIRVRTHLLPEEELQTAVLFPDDTRLHRPGSPLEVALVNFAAANKTVALTWRMESFQGRITKGRADIPVPAGGKVLRKLVGSLSPGIYALTVEPAGGRPVREHVLVVEAGRHFGKTPRELLTRMPELRKLLGMTTGRVYLDWDNVEGIPGLYHFDWFNVAVKKALADGVQSAVPVVGFSADWASPHQRKSVAKGEYSRFIPDRLQVPVRLVDWSRFVRVCSREFRGRFGRWEFWENADLASSPQGIPPGRYPKMLEAFTHWVSLYNPKARIVAGGFNMEKVLGYLDSVKKAADLPFHELSIQMSLGDLSPERADVEELLDELNGLLQVARTGKKVQLREMDWPVGKYVTPLQQAAYHVRAMLILNSRGALPHRFKLTAPGQEFTGPGIFYRVPYGNSENVQTLKPVHVPKPAYFAYRHAREFLRTWRFVEAVALPEFDRQANRAFLYRDAAGRLAVAVWRTVEKKRLYNLPGTWKSAKAVDAFGFDLPLQGGLPSAGVPAFVFLPAGTRIEQARQHLRTLPPADGTDRVLMDLHLAEPPSCAQAGYAATGTTKRREHVGQIPGGRRVRRSFVDGLRRETFEFTPAAPGDVLLSRLWWLEGNGVKLTVSLNGGPALPWDLTRSKLGAKDSGVRESTFVLAGCRAGKNTVAIAYESPGNCGGYRLEPLAGPSIDLCRWGILHALQTKGRLAKLRSAAGTGLAIGKTRYPTGLGTHAVSLIEYPLNGQFGGFEATVGIDAVTDGRGTAVFEVVVDGSRRAASKVLNGFSKPETLKVDGLKGADRLVLLVKDAGDGNGDDLANWVNARLILAK